MVRSAINVSIFVKIDVRLSILHIFALKPRNNLTLPIFIILVQLWRIFDFSCSGRLRRLLVFAASNWRHLQRWRYFVGRFLHRQSLISLIVLSVIWHSSTIFPFLIFFVPFSLFRNSSLPSIWAKSWPLMQCQHLARPMIIILILNMLLRCLKLSQNTRLVWKLICWGKIGRLVLVSSWEFEKAFRRRILTSLLKIIILLLCCARVVDLLRIRLLQSS